MLKGIEQGLQDIVEVRAAVVGWEVVDLDRQRTWQGLDAAGGEERYPMLAKTSPVTADQCFGTTRRQ